MPSRPDLTPKPLPAEPTAAEWGSSILSGAVGVGLVLVFCPAWRCSAAWRM